MINNIFNVAKVLGGGQNLDNSRFLRAFLKINIAFYLMGETFSQTWRISDSVQDE